MAQAKESNFMSKFAGIHSNALSHLTSKQFFDVWSNYDSDGNGYIEGSELDNFLREFVTSIHDEKQEPLDEGLLQELKKAFMDAYDKNRDGRIDIRELAQLLPIEESFKLLFKFETQVDSSVEFMRIWTKYDSDSSGSIDADELKDFLRDLIAANQAISSQHSGRVRKSTSLEEEKLAEYTETLLKIFDANKDGKLQLSEMTKLLLVKENFLSCYGIFQGSDKKLSKQDIERIFNSYDVGRQANKTITSKDAEPTASPPLLNTNDKVPTTHNQDSNGVIENEELHAFIKDLMDYLGKVPDSSDLEEFERMVMAGCDANGDGKINKKELTTVLLALAKHASSVSAET